MSVAGVPDVTARGINGHRTASMETRYDITQESAQVLAAIDDLVGRDRAWIQREVHRDGTDDLGQRD